MVAEIVDQFIPQIIHQSQAIISFCTIYNLAEITSFTSYEKCYVFFLPQKIENIINEHLKKIHLEPKIKIIFFSNLFEL